MLFLAYSSIACLALFPPAPGTEVKLELKTIPATIDRAALPPVGAARLPVTLSDQPVAGAPKDPDGLTEVVRGKLEIAGAKLAIALGKKDADADCVDTAAIDLDGDGKFARAEIVEIPIRANDMKTDKGTEKMYSGSVTSFALKRPMGELPFSLSLSFARNKLSVSAMPRWYSSGVAHVGDTDVTICFQDVDGDAKFDGAADRWGIVAAADLGKKSLNSTSMAALDERIYVNKNNVGAKLHGTDKAELALEAASAPDPKDLAKARVRVGKEWAARFDKERDQFVKDQSVDTKRALAKDEIHWNFITFDAAQKLSKDQNKPLFVDVMAYWCVWCYRMDYYTYPDAEVASVLNTKYIPVKIIQEQDQIGDYEKVRKLLDAQGIPAMGVWTPSGDLVHKIGGWEKPEDFLTDLNKGLDLATKKPAGG